MLQIDMMFLLNDYLIYVWRRETRIFFFQHLRIETKTKIQTNALLVLAQKLSKCKNSYINICEKIICCCYTVIEFAKKNVVQINHTLYSLNMFIVIKSSLKIHTTLNKSNDLLFKIRVRVTEKQIQKLNNNS